MLEKTKKIIFNVATLAGLVFATTPVVEARDYDSVGNHDSMARLDFDSGTSDGTDGASFQLCQDDDFTGLAVDGTPECISRQEAIEYMDTGTLPPGFTPIDPQDGTATNILFRALVGLDVSGGKTLEDFKIGTHYDALGPNVVENLFFVEYTEDGQEKLFVDRAGAVFSESGFQRYRDSTTVIFVANNDTSQYETLDQYSGANGDEIFNQGQADERLYSKLKAFVDIDGNFYRQPGQAPGGIELGTVDANFSNPGVGDNPYVNDDGLIWLVVDYVVSDAYSEFDPPPDRLEMDKRVQDADNLAGEYNFDDFEDSVSGIEGGDRIRYSVFLHEEDFGTTAKNLVLSDDGGVLDEAEFTNTINADYERTVLENGSFINQPYNKNDSTTVSLTTSGLTPRYVPGSTRVYDKDYNPVDLPQLGGGNVIPDVNGESALYQDGGYLYNLDPFNPSADYLQGCWRFIRYIEYEVEFLEDQPQLDLEIDKSVQELPNPSDPFVGEDEQNQGLLTLTDGETAEVRYKIKITNNSDQEVQNIVHTDSYESLDNGGTLTNITNVTPAGVTVGGDPASGIFTVTVPSIPANSTATVTFDATVNKGNVSSNTIRNTITIDSVDGEIPDPKLSDYVDVEIDEEQQPDEIPVKKEVALDDNNNSYGPTADLTETSGTVYYRATVENTGDATQTVTLEDDLFRDTRQITREGATITLLSGLNSTTICSANSNIADCVTITGSTPTNGQQDETSVTFEVPANSTVTVKYAASVVNTSTSEVSDIRNTVTPSGGNVVCSSNNNTIGSAADEEDCDAYITILGETQPQDEITIYKEVAKTDGTTGYENLSFGPVTTLDSETGVVIYKVTVNNPTSITRPVTVTDTMWDPQSVDLTSNIRRLVKDSANITLLDWDDRDIISVCNSPYIGDCVQIEDGTLASTNLENVNILVPANGTSYIYYAASGENTGTSTVEDIENQISPVAPNGQPDVTVVCPPDGALGSAGDNQDCDAFVTIPGATGDEDAEIIKEVSGSENGSYSKQYETAENPDYAWYRITITNPNNNSLTTTVSDDLWEGPIISNGASVEFVARDSDDTGTVSSSDIRVEGAEGATNFDNSTKEIEVTVPGNDSVEIYYRGKITSTVDVLKKMVNTVTNEYCPTPTTNGDIGDCQAEVCINTEVPEIGIDKSVARLPDLSPTAGEGVKNSGNLQLPDGQTAEVRYTLVVTNNGELNHQNVVIEDAFESLDNGGTLSIDENSFTSTDNLATASNFTVNGFDITISTLGGGDTVTITFDATVNLGAVDENTIRNTVTVEEVDGEEIEPPGPSDYVDVTIGEEVQPEEPVVIKQVKTSKTNGQFVNSGEAEDEEVVEYKITVDNTQNNSESTTVTLSDSSWKVNGTLRQIDPSELPQGVTAVLQNSAGNNNCDTGTAALAGCLTVSPTRSLIVTGSNGGISFVIGADETVEITYKVKVTNPTASQVTVKNIIAPSGATCPDTEPDCDAEVIILPQEDVPPFVIKQVKTSQTNSRYVDTASAQSDEVVEYRLTIDNSDPDSIQRTVTLTDTFWEVNGGLRQATGLPQGVTAVMQNLQGTADCETSLSDLVNCLRSDPSVALTQSGGDNETISFTIDAGEVANLYYNVKIINTTNTGVRIQNTAVPADNNLVCPPSEPDCDAIVDVEPTPPEFDIIKEVKNVTRTYEGDTSQNVSALPGDEIEFTAKVQQIAGPTPQVVTVFDEVDNRFNVIEGSISNGGVYNSMTRTIIWDSVAFSALNTETRLTFRVTTQGLQKGTVIPNVAVVSTSKDDVPDKESNRVEVEIVAPELSIDKAVIDRKDSYSPGENVSYRITVTNISNQPAVNVRVTDTLPQGLNFISAEPAATPDASRILSWDIRRLNPGESVIIQVNVNIQIDLPASTIENIATVSYTNENEEPMPEKEDREVINTELIKTGTEILMALIISLLGASAVILAVLKTKKKRREDTKA
jgi:uncharacterized repeat protein (TIGR01451 family)/fimbrial isopeptide formation D2 family protein